MSLAPVGPLGAYAPSATTRLTTSSGFLVQEQRPAGASQSSAAATPAMAVTGNMMLLLQEQLTAEARDRDARRRGQELLTALAKLQRALLSSEVGSADLRQLQHLVEGLPAAEDPALAGVLRSILLRARLELARAGLGAT